MTKFPVDAPRARVVRAFELLGFRLVREREHISMVRENAGGTRTTLTLPGHAQEFDAANDLHSGRHRPTGVRASV